MKKVDLKLLINGREFSIDSSILINHTNWYKFSIPHGTHLVNESSFHIHNPSLEDAIKTAKSLGMKRLFANSDKWVGNGRATMGQSCETPFTNEVWREEEVEYGCPFDEKL